MDLGGTELGGMGWVSVALDRDKGRALVNDIMNFGFHKMLGNYRVATQLVTS
jgi:hypothetical protein